MALALTLTGVMALFSGSAIAGVQLISRAPTGGYGDGESINASITTDGGRVAFQSDARNLGPTIDEFVATNVFVWDGASSTVISGALTNIGAPLGSVVPPDRVQNFPSISGNGNKVAFHSTASNIFVTPSTHGNTYLTSFGFGTSLLATKYSSPEEPILGSGTPWLSGDATFAAVHSTSTDLLGDPFLSPDGIYHVEICCHGGGLARNRLINHVPGSPTTVDDSTDIRHVALSADGRRAVFTSDATNLVSPTTVDADATTNVYVWDLNTGLVKLASRASGADGAPGNGRSINSAISADGRYVSFESVSTNLDPMVPPGYQEVYVRDLETQTTTLVSRQDGAAGAPANFPGTGLDQLLSTSISGDGRYVAFSSKASNLTSEDCQISPGFNYADVFLRDRVTNTTRLISRAARRDDVCKDDTGVNGDSEAPQLSADGAKLTFVSRSTNLGPPGNLDGRRQLYLADTGASAPTGAAPTAPPGSGPASAPQAKDTTAPTLGKLKIAPSVFAVLKAKGATAAKAREKAPRGATITFTTNEVVTVRLDVLTRPTAAAKGSTRKPKPRRRPARKLGSLKRPAVSGRNRLAFAGIVAGKALAPGRYTIKATATDAAGNASHIVNATFQIVGAR